MGLGGKKRPSGERLSFVAGRILLRETTTDRECSSSLLLGWSARSLSSSDLPDLNRAIEANGDQELATRVKGDAIHCVLMSWHRGHIAAITNAKEPDRSLGVAHRK